METSVMSINGQLVIPAKIRKKYELKSGMKIAFVEKEGRLLIQPLDKNYFISFAGILNEKGKMLRSLAEDKKKEKEL